MTNAPIPYILALVGISIESALLGLYVWRRARSGRGVVPFTLLMASLSMWTLCYATELSFADIPSKLWPIRVEFVGITTAPVVILLFCIDNTGRERWLTRRNLILLFVVPALTVLMLWTNEFHHLFYASYHIDTSAGFPNFVAKYGVWFWVHAVYSYLVMLAGVVIMARSFTNLSQVFRGQAATVMAAMLVPWVGNAIYLSGLSPLDGLDLTPFAIAITGVMLAISLLRFRLLDIVPAARDMVVDSMGDALMVFDMDRRLVDLNPAARALLGDAAVGAIGKMLSEVLPDLKDLILRFRDVEETQAEIVVPTADGAMRTLELRLSTLRNRRGVATGRLAVLHDITQTKLNERKLAEARDQALEALRMRSRILAVVSHELRTPLGAILGYADMLRAGAQGPISETQMTVVNRMISNAVHLTDLVNDLLDEAQIEQGKITLHIAPIEPAKLMEAVETAMGQRAREHGLRLVTTVAPGAPEVIRTDLSRMTQIVNNLVGNALKFTRQGDVTVSVIKADEDHWGISVKDSGPGIAEENQKLIFEPFWQVDHPETREHKGVGLGLSIARQMTQLLGGEIKLESESGKGTTFTVIFPWISAQEKMISGEKVPGAGR